MNQSLTLTALVVRDYDEVAVQDYGTVAVFEDLYGTQWDLVEFSDSTTAPKQAGRTTI
jgi:hypothetical protein